MGGTMEDISDQTIYPGVKIYESSTMNGAIALGNVIFVSPGMNTHPDKAHEYGHFLDFKYHFKYNSTLYFKEVGLPSLKSAINATFRKKDHSQSQTELRADILGGAYFNLKLFKPKK